MCVHVCVCVCVCVFIGTLADHLGTPPPLGPNSFIFMQFSAKNLQNNPNLGIGTSLEKILNLHWCVCECVCVCVLCMFVCLLLMHWQIPDFLAGENVTAEVSSLIRLTNDAFRFKTPVFGSNAES